MWAYCDSSVIVKLYVEEPGSHEVLQLLQSYECSASALLPIELRSALRRRVAEGTLDSARVPGILKEFAADRAHWPLVEIGPTVLAAAETVVANHPVRALDAIHVASAQFFATRLPAAALTFVSADRRQAEAAAAVGLVVRRLAL